MTLIIFCCVWIAHILLLFSFRLFCRFFFHFWWQQKATRNRRKLFFFLFNSPLFQNNTHKIKRTRKHSKDMTKSQRTAYDVTAHRKTFLISCCFSWPVSHASDTREMLYGNIKLEWRWKHSSLSFCKWCDELITIMCHAQHTHRHTQTHQNSYIASNHIIHVTRTPNESKQHDSSSSRAAAAAATAPKDRVKRWQQGKLNLKHRGFARNETKERLIKSSISEECDCGGCGW